MRSAASLFHRYGRSAALAAVPLVVLAASARSRLGAHPPAGARATLTPATDALAAVAVAAAIWLGVTILRTRRRHKADDAPQAPRWHAGNRAQLIALLVTAALLLAPLVFASVLAARHAGSVRNTTPTIRAVSPGTAVRSSTPAHAASEPHTTITTVLVVVAVLVLAAAAGWVAHRRHSRITDAPRLPAASLEQAVVEGLRRGAEALATTDDVRAAITRCYVAMQGGLDEAGLPRSPVRTPTELLDAAIAQRLLPAAPATALTRLFERARFSSTPMTDADRDSARDALESLRAERAQR